ncbi:hypothetical protein [Dehalobacterium formicoaceticum]|uniref:DUF4367 domain-containing protein n=1 Tax=Dehalobacterium formicoaceticum TaxID=51515 RepID=A0ABT1Y6L1_9FIRM|nr:hypothetical protein [Dehalobacterium formicoaceticum]MCR6546513.1 hypothetical protein [Dehalobacterium formicoaceticum]
MKINEYKDEEIRLNLIQKAAEAEPSAEMFSRIKKNITETGYEEKMRGKIFGFKRGKMSVAVLTCCVLLLVSTAVIGTNLATSWKGHSTNSQYMTFPSVDRVIKDVGFAPKYTEMLPGGFKFSRGGTGESELSDEAGNVLTKTKDVNFAYTRGSEKSSISLNVSQIKEEFIDNSSSSLVDNYNGINLYYYEKDYKFVPPAYELTEEDKKAYEAGELEISYGSPEVSYQNIKGLSWYEDGLQYMIMGSDYNFTLKEMVEMSKAIIDTDAK